ncbi:MAG: 3'-5' exoribonuclease [Nitrosomonadales bacterium]|nr:3'-5' exoribonuclease [Nitrosomonadales bacterium]
MKWLGSWFGPKVRLDTGQQRRLTAWQALPQAELKVPVAESRCVVVDVETTGLNLMQDRLISIGAVAVVNGKIALGDSFYVVLQQQAASDKGNILLHGIGTSAQLEGEPPVEALLAFLEYLGKSPLVAFHVTFDETMIKRALRDYLGLNFKHPWSDLAYVMPGLNPPLARKYRALDHWIGHFNIRIDARHNALADALATAQLFQVAHAQALGKNIPDMAGLRDLEKNQRWVSAVS